MARNREQARQRIRPPWRCNRPSETTTLPTKARRMACPPTAPTRL